MKTDALIRALALDATRPVVPVGRLIAGALALGSVASAALFWLTLHPRPDIASALFTAEFGLKVVAAVGLALTSVGLLVTTARPLTGGLRLGALLFAPLLILSGVVLELATVPRDAWTGRLIGSNAPHCLALIPLLAAAPATSLMLALRRAAPARPAFAGFVIGLTSGAIGASFYALTCPDDSPLFVATWYSIAIAFMTGACTIIGRHWLRW